MAMRCFWPPDRRVPWYVCVCARARARVTARQACALVLCIRAYARQILCIGALLGRLDPLLDPLSWIRYADPRVASAPARRWASR